MKIVYLNRDYLGSKQSLGFLSIADTDFYCKSLELPWVNNETAISCIPAGEYLCRWTRSNRISKVVLNKWLKNNPGKTIKDAPDEVRNVYTYEVLNVRGRSGIRIHAANYFFQLRGCIALGSALKDINIDQNLDLIHSGLTVDRFNKLMNKEDFKLIIKHAA